MEESCTIKESPISSFKRSGTDEKRVHFSDIVSFSDESSLSGEDFIQLPRASSPNHLRRRPDEIIDLSEIASLQPENISDEKNLPPQSSRRASPYPLKKFHGNGLLDLSEVSSEDSDKKVNEEEDKSKAEEVILNQIQEERSSSNFRKFFNKIFFCFSRTPSLEVEEIDFKEDTGKLFGSISKRKSGLPDLCDLNVEAIIEEQDAEKKAAKEGDVFDKETIQNTIKNTGNYRREDRNEIISTMKSVESSKQRLFTNLSLHVAFKIRQLLDKTDKEIIKKVNETEADTLKASREFISSVKENRRYIKKDKEEGAKEIKKEAPFYEGIYSKIEEFENIEFLLDKYPEIKLDYKESKTVRNIKEEPIKEEPIKETFTDRYQKLKEMFPHSSISIDKIEPTIKTRAIKKQTSV